MTVLNYLDAFIIALLAGLLWGLKSPRWLNVWISMFLAFFVGAGILLAHSGLALILNK